MPISAVMLQFFNETTTYWLLRYLLFKSRYIQNDIDLYHCFIKELEIKFRKILPNIYQHITENGFELNYFVMKWIMGLFAEDLSKTMLLAVWDLLFQTELEVLMYVIIAIFSMLEEELLRSGEDDINDLMKLRLRERV